MSVPEQTPGDRCYTAWAIVGELVVAILTSVAAKAIGARIAMLAEGGWLPGMGDVRTIGALTGRSFRSLEDVACDKPRPKFKVGRQTFYRLDSFATPKEASKSDDGG